MVPVLQVNKKKIIKISGKAFKILHGQNINRKFAISWITSKPVFSLNDIYSYIKCAKVTYNKEEDS